MNIDANVITVNGVEYVEASKVASCKEFDGEIKIVILQRGWVLVGKWERNDSVCKLHNAAVIRSWGTSKGLGELAEAGPLSGTKLDKCFGVVEFDYMTMVASIACKEQSWKNKI